MNGILSRLRYIKSDFLNSKFEIKMIYIIVVSMFLAPFAVIAPVVFFGCYILYQKVKIRSVFQVKGILFASGFILVSIISPLIFENMVGVIGGIFMFFALIVGIRLRQIMDKSIFDNILVLICFLSWFSFIVALTQKSYYGFEMVNQHIFRSMSTFFNPNYYAFIIDMVIIICIFKIFTNSRNASFYWVTICLNIFGLILTLNRSAYLSIFVAVIVLLFLLRKKLAAILTMFLALILLTTVIFVPKVFPRYESFENNTEVRMEIFTVGVKAITTNPFFGNGLWGYRQIAKKVTYPMHERAKLALHSHSIFLDPLVSFGIIGVFCLIMYFVFQLKALFKNSKENNTTPLAYLVIACLIATFIHNAVDLPIVGIETSVLMLIILSISGVESRLSRKH